MTPRESSCWMELLESIIEAFHQEVYAETTPSERQLSQVRFAMRRVRRPIHWPSRLRSRLRQPQPAVILTPQGERMWYNTFRKDALWIFQKS